MASVLAAESNNNVGFMAVKDTVASFLGGLTNVLLSSASLAKVENKDSTENITGYTGNLSTGGTVSTKERVSNSTDYSFYPVWSPGTYALRILLYLAQYHNTGNSV